MANSHMPNWHLLYFVALFLWQKQYWKIYVSAIKIHQIGIDHTPERTGGVLLCIRYICCSVRACSCWSFACHTCIDKPRTNVATGNCCCCCCCCRVIFAVTATDSQVFPVAICMWEVAMSVCVDYVRVYHLRHSGECVQLYAGSYSLLALCEEEKKKQQQLNNNSM